MPKLPFRSIIVASSTGGKTVLIQNLILNVYRNSFARIFIFSPSVHNDPTFTEVKKYIRDGLHVDDEKEQIYFDNYNPSDLENVIERQKKIINYMKSKKIKKLHSILIQHRAGAARAPRRPLVCGPAKSGARRPRDAAALRGAGLVPEGLAGLHAATR